MRAHGSSPPSSRARALLALPPATPAPDEAASPWLLLALHAAWCARAACQRRQGIPSGGVTRSIVDLRTANPSSVPPGCRTSRAEGPARGHVERCSFDFDSCSRATTAAFRRLGGAVPAAASARQGALAQRAWPQQHAWVQGCASGSADAGPAGNPAPPPPRPLARFRSAFTVCTAGKLIRRLMPTRRTQSRSLQRPQRYCSPLYIAPTRAPFAKRTPHTPAVVLQSHRDVTRLPSP